MSQREFFRAVFNELVVKESRLMIAFRLAAEFRSHYPGLPEGMARERDIHAVMATAFKQAIDGYESEGGLVSLTFALEPALNLHPIDIYHKQDLEIAERRLSEAVVDGFFQMMQQYNIDTGDRNLVRQQLQNAITTYVNEYEDTVWDVG